MKTITVSEDAYDLLIKLRHNGESFTETIKRLAKRRRLIDCAGSWSDVPEEEMKAFWHSIDELRLRATEAQT